MQSRPLETLPFQTPMSSRKPRLSRMWGRLQSRKSRTRTKLRRMMSFTSITSTTRNSHTPPSRSSSSSTRLERKPCSSRAASNGWERTQASQTNCRLTPELSLSWRTATLARQLRANTWLVAQLRWFKDLSQAFFSRCQGKSQKSAASWALWLFLWLRRSSSKPRKLPSLHSFNSMSAWRMCISSLKPTRPWQLGNQPSIQTLISATCRRSNRFGSSKPRRTQEAQSNRWRIFRLT